MCTRAGSSVTTVNCAGVMVGTIFIYKITFPVSQAAGVGRARGTIVTYLPDMVADSGIANLLCAQVSVVTIHIGAWVAGRSGVVATDAIGASINGTINAVIAIDGIELTSVGRMATICCAGIAIIAHNRLMTASTRRCAGVDSTFVVVVAIFCSILAAKTRITIVIGASIIIVAINLNKQTACNWITRIVQKAITSERAIVTNVFAHVICITHIPGTNITIIAICIRGARSRYVTIVKVVTSAICKWPVVLTTVSSAGIAIIAASDILLAIGSVHTVACSIITKILCTRGIVVAATASDRRTIRVMRTNAALTCIYGAGIIVVAIGSIMAAVGYRVMSAHSALAIISSTIIPVIAISNRMVTATICCAAAIGRACIGILTNGE